MKKFLQTTLTKLPRNNMGSGLSNRFFHDAIHNSPLHQLGDCVHILEKGRSGWQRLEQAISKIDGPVANEYERYLSDSDAAKVLKVAKQHSIPMGDESIDTVYRSFNRELLKMGRVELVELEAELNPQRMKL